MKFQAIFFDIDNTLLSFDEYVRHTMEEGFSYFGLKPYEPWMFDAFTRVNNGLWRRIEEGSLSFEELTKIRWNQVFEVLGIAFDGPTFEKYFRGALNESAIPEPGALELLTSLKGKYLLYAASNGPYGQQVHRLQIAGMYEIFDDVFISEKVGVAKPAKAFFDYAFAKINTGRNVPLMPEECLMVGDSLTSDIAGGLAYGMKTCLYLRGRKLDVPEGVLTVDSLEQLQKLGER